MPTPRALFLLFAPFFLLLTAALVVALDRISVSLFDEVTPNFYNGPRVITLFGPTENGATPEEYNFIDVKINERNGIVIALMCTAALAFLVSFISACGIWELRKIVAGEEGFDFSARGSWEGRGRKWSWVTLFVNVMMVGGALGVLGWTSSVQAGEGWKNGYEDVGKEEQKWMRET